MGCGKRVWIAAGLQRRFAQCDLRRSSGPHPIRRFAPPSPAELGKGPGMAPQRVEKIESARRNGMAPKAWRPQDLAPPRSGAPGCAKGSSSARLGRREAPACALRRCATGASRCHPRERGGPEMTVLKVRPERRPGWTPAFAGVTVLDTAGKSSGLADLGRCDVAEKGAQAFEKPATVDNA